MKEATGEGSMTIVTIVIIVALAAAAAIVIGIMATTAGNKANQADSNGYSCTKGTDGSINCTQN